MTSPLDSKITTSFNKDLVVSRQITKPAVQERTVTQYVLRLSHTPGQSVEVLVGTGYINPTTGLLVVDEGSAQNHYFTGAAYTALLSANPSWSPKKPQGTYRDSDIFNFIDFVKLELAREAQEAADNAAVEAARRQAEVEANASI